MKKIYGLLGKNISYSFSPLLHNEIFKILDKQYEYKIFDIEKEEISFLIDKLRKNEVSGFNVTIPYKQEIIKYLDEMSENAKKIGAINTVYIKNNKIIGDNTDYYGFLKTVEKMNLNLKNKTVAILGTGGSAKAVIQVIKNLKGNIVVVSRNPDISDEYFKNFTLIDYEKLKSLSGELIVNCTPLGGKNQPNSSPIDENTASSWNSAIDLNYNPEISVFLSYFSDKPHSNGLYMLIAQGVQSEIIWQNKNILVDEVYNKVYNDVYTNK